MATPEQARVQVRVRLDVGKEELDVGKEEH